MVVRIRSLILYPFVLSLLFLGTIIVPESPRACVKVFAGAPNVRVIFGVPTRIRFENYEAFGSGPGQFCACAFKEIGEIASIDAVTIAVAGTNVAIGGLDGFTSNAVTSAGFEAVATGNFEGFATTVSEIVPEGEIVDIVFTVTLTPGATPASLKADLESSGGIGTDEGDATGSPTGNHQNINSIGTVTVEAAPVSSLGRSAIGALMLALALIVVALVRLRS